MSAMNKSLCTMQVERGGRCGQLDKERRIPMLDAALRLDMTYDLHHLRFLAVRAARPPIARPQQHQQQYPQQAPIAPTQYY